MSVHIGEKERKTDNKRGRKVARVRCRPALSFGLRGGGGSGNTGRPAIDPHWTRPVWRQRDDWKSEIPSARSIRRRRLIFSAPPKAPSLSPRLTPTTVRTGRPPPTAYHYAGRHRAAAAVLIRAVAAAGRIAGGALRCSITHRARRQLAVIAYRTRFLIPLRPPSSVFHKRC